MRRVCWNTQCSVSDMRVLAISDVNLIPSSRTITILNLVLAMDRLREALYSL